MAPRTITITSTVQASIFPSMTAAAVSDDQTPTSLYLPAQTTPFWHNGPGCTPSIYCADLTTAIYDQTSYQFGVSLCFGVNAVESTYSVGENSAGPIMTSSVYMAYNNACMPDNYYELFGDMRQQAVYDWPHATSEGSRSTLAYPGTACPRGWAAACTTTLAHEGLAYPQEWCCPPGDWQCTSGVGALDPSSGPQRLCVSAVAAATEVWMSFDPATTLGDGSPAYTWHVPVSGSGALVYHKVFPLSLAEGGGGVGGESSRAVRGDDETYTTAVETITALPSSSLGLPSGLGEATAVGPPIGVPEGSGSKASTVAVTGTMTGAVAVVGLATWALLRHKRRRQAKVRQAVRGTQSTGTLRSAAKTGESVSNKGLEDVMRS
ncbi:hypothetical protein E8E14_009514 [Neopestalotiopsis sp. 37M]|nr:hypothetical protein E8E14_009514 [Neopestalotiopsis sp. 37M]